MKIILPTLLSLVFAITVSSQSKDAAIEKEVLQVRNNIRAAVKEKDRALLNAFLAPGFTHIHASGKVDDKTERVAFFLRGEPSIEDVQPEEIRVIVFNKNLATAIGRTSLLFGTEKRTFQWTSVYFKEKGKWRMAASHATSLKN